MLCVAGYLFQSGNPHCLGQGCPGGIRRGGVQGADGLEHVEYCRGVHQGGELFVSREVTLSHATLRYGKLRYVTLRQVALREAELWPILRLQNSQLNYTVALHNETK